ncbi:MAG TPA: heavy metal-associated domain-containing protein [Opitutaceae bacterium]
MKSLAKIIGVGLVALALPFAALAGSEKSKNLNLDVPNLTSANAEAQVQAALSGIEGVEIKQVNSKSGTVHVMIDTEKVSPETVVNALKSAGFEAKVRAEQQS